MANDLQRTGKIVDWNDARGFGFISGPDVRGRIFFHIKDVVGSTRPTLGDDVAYRLIEGRDGRPAASGVVIAGARLAVMEDGERQDAPMRVTIRVVGALVLATAVICCIVTGRAPPWLGAVYLVGGAVSFAAYWLDKEAAMLGRWRTREETLHLIDLAFGIAGGLLAQGLLRHKSSKQSFGVVSALILALHLAGLGIVLAGYSPAEWLAWLTS